MKFRCVNRTTRNKDSSHHAFIPRIKSETETNINKHENFQSEKEVVMEADFQKFNIKEAADIQ